MRKPMTWLFPLLFSLACACSPAASDAGNETITLDEAPPPDDSAGSDGTPDETAGGGENLVLSEDACETDADCVPQGCCHPASCGVAASAPACGEVMCTTDCRYGTLDCGGRCLCHEGRCAAQLSRPPEGLAPPGAQ